MTFLVHSPMYDSFRFFTLIVPPVHTGHEVIPLKGDDTKRDGEQSSISS